MRIAKNLEDIELLHCNYFSSETEEFDNGKILSKLEMSRENNSKINVTGMLCIPPAELELTRLFVLEMVIAPR